jgi:hypothetical protein
MFKTDKRLTGWYHQYNKKYFDNKLTSHVTVGWDLEIEADAGRTHGVRFHPKEDGIDLEVATIHLHPDKHVGSTDARFTLLHEMCHLRLLPWTRHGKKFNDEMRRLAILGAFDDLW